MSLEHSVDYRKEENAEPILYYCCNVYCTLLLLLLKSKKKKKKIGSGKKDAVYTWKLPMTKSGTI